MVQKTLTQPHDESVIAKRPRDPNWLGVGSEADTPPNRTTHTQDLKQKQDDTPTRDKARDQQG